jgi:hypothetical protein
MGVWGFRATDRRSTAASLISLRTAGNPCGGLRRFLALDRRIHRFAYNIRSLRNAAVRLLCGGSDDRRSHLAEIRVCLWARWKCSLCAKLQTYSIADALGPANAAGARARPLPALEVDRRLCEHDCNAPHWHRQHTRECARSDCDTHDFVRRPTGHFIWIESSRRP